MFEPPEAVSLLMLFSVFLKNSRITIWVRPSDDRSSRGRNASLDVAHTVFDFSGIRELVTLFLGWFVLH